MILPPRIFAPGEQPSLAITLLARTPLPEPASEHALKRKIAEVVKRVRPRSCAIRRLCAASRTSIPRSSIAGDPAAFTDKI